MNLNPPPSLVALVPYPIRTSSRRGWKRLVDDWFWGGEGMGSQRGGEASLANRMGVFMFGKLQRIFSLCLSKLALTALSKSALTALSRSALTTLSRYALT